LLRIPNPVSDLAGGIPKYVFFDGEHVDISHSSNSDPLREGKLSNPCARRAGSMHGENLRKPARERLAGAMHWFPIVQVYSNTKCSTAVRRTTSTKFSTTLVEV
jgi:hypothetical protein